VAGADTLSPSVIHQAEVTIASAAGTTMENGASITTRVIKAPPAKDHSFLHTSRTAARLRILSKNIEPP
jgi:hypothetical protein